MKVSELRQFFDRIVSDTMECNKNKNLKMCNCTFSCSRKGMCCECLEYHRKRDELPACYFPADVEKSGDRSIEAYLRCRA
jgi:hypothetical protein